MKMKHVLTLTVLALAGASYSQIVFEKGIPTMDDGNIVRDSTFDKTEGGRGTVKRNAGEREFGRLRVRFFGQNSFEVDPRLGKDFLVRGEYSRSRTSPTSYLLSIKSIGGEQATGEGAVLVNGRGGFISAGVNGQSTMGRFSLSFDSSGNGSGGGNVIGDRSFIDKARKAVTAKFPRGTRFNWSSEGVSPIQFGNRMVNGSFEIKSGEKAGKYTYNAVLGAGTGNVKEVFVNRK